MSYQSETDSDLEFYLRDMGIKDPLFNTTAVRELLYQAGREASESEVGQELAQLLVSTGRPADFLSQRVSSEITRRFGSSKVMPGVPTVARTIEVYGDLLMELKPFAPKSAPAPTVKPKANLSQPEAPSKDATFFAHMYNYAYRERPTSTLRPKAGVITLVDRNTGKHYEYPIKRFDELYSEAEKFRLIEFPNTMIQRSY